MRFTRTGIPDVWLVQTEPREDRRGHFARTFCADEFAAHGLPVAFPQCNISFNTSRGTLRGLHWQDPPYGEGKLIRCTRGAILDVAVDVRAGSPTRGRFISATLTEDNADALYIPDGFAHGFQTLTDRAEVFYQMTERYRPGLERGLRWDDPALAIRWPLTDPVMSDRDRALPLSVP
jgi:dTDP-4-dehydrorhamnose 3,5-epimerase